MITISLQTIDCFLKKKTYRLIFPDNIITRNIFILISFYININQKTFTWIIFKKNIELIFFFKLKPKLTRTALERICKKRLNWKNSIQKKSTPATSIWRRLSLIEKRMRHFFSYTIQQTITFFFFFFHLINNELKIYILAN